MKFSIITPTFNSSSSIRDCAYSVIKQQYDDYEHIIVDNVSSDDTVKILKELYRDAGKEDKLIILSEKDNGISDAFNKGIAKALGNVVVILNSDDVFADTLLFSKNADIFMNEKILFTHGNIYFADDKFGSNIRRPLLCPITSAMPFNHPGMFIRKSVYEKFGVYDTDYRYAMDYELICRYEKQIPDFRAHGHYFSGEPIAIMNSGGASWSSGIDCIKEIKKLLKKNQFWTLSARISYCFFLARIQTRDILSKLGLDIIVVKWRQRKWE